MHGADARVPRSRHDDESRPTWLAQAPSGEHIDSGPRRGGQRMIDMNQVVGRMNVLFVTLDCLRLDVARHCLAAGRTPHLAAVLPRTGWETRETPGTFTLPAHLSFFHGFLPTPVGPGPHPRLFALEFDGSLTTAATTFVFRGVD